jgi:hypothetical protein
MDNLAIIQRRFGEMRGSFDGLFLDSFLKLFLKL